MEKIEKNSNTNRRDLQFPSNLPKNAGYAPGIKRILNKKSALVERCFYLSLLKNKKNNKSQIEHLLTCYRFFKECRNSIVHRGGRADQRAEEIHKEFSSLAPQDISSTEIPENFPVQAQKKIKLSLRGVVGLSDVVFKLIATLDAELALSEKAEKEFCRQWMNVNGKKYSLKSDGNGRNTQVKRLVQKLGLPEPMNCDYLARYLKDNRLVN